METVTIPKAKYESMKTEIETFRNTRLYKRILAFEKNRIKGKIYTREELGI